MGASEDISRTLLAHYPPFKLRRLDAYSQAGLLAARLAMAGADMKAGDGEGPALLVCTGPGPVLATNAFMDSFLEFGPQGASPTAFSQTVHNLAASTVSMFLDLRGPALSVSQPAFGVPAGLATASYWLASGMTRMVLFGAVDVRSGFSRELFGDGRDGAEWEGAAAVFAVLAPADAAPSGLALVDDFSFGGDVGACSTEASATPQSHSEGRPAGSWTVPGARTWDLAGPVDVLSSLVAMGCGLAPDGRDVVTERREGKSASITIRRHPEAGR